MHYTPTTHPAPLPSTALLCTQLINTKHCRQNGTRCRDGLSPSCLSGFWGFLPYMHLFSFGKHFCDFIIYNHCFSTFKQSCILYPYIIIKALFENKPPRDRGNLQTKDKRPVPKCPLFRGLTVSTVYTSLIPRRGEGGGEKGAPGVYCMCMCVKFLENRITSGHLRYTDFCEVANFYCVEDAYHNHALCEWWRGSDESTQLFDCKNDPCVCLFQLNATTSDDVIFPLKFTNASNKAMQTITIKAI